MEFCQYEYTYARAREGLYGILKWALILFYIIFVLAYFLLIFLTRMIPLGALIPIALWILIFFTWKYACQEYKYEISGSEISFSVLYGRKAKPKTKIHINEAESIIPLAVADDAIKSFAPQRIYDAKQKKNDPDTYAMLYRDREGKRCLFVFKATDEALRFIRIYNKSLQVRESEI